MSPLDSLPDSDSILIRFRLSSNLWNNDINEHLHIYDTFLTTKHPRGVTAWYTGMCGKYGAGFTTQIINMGVLFKQNI